MTLHALAGLAVLNALYLLAGVSLVWLVRGFGTWGEIARLGGLAYLLGVVVVGATWVLLLLVAAPHSGAIVVVVPIGVVCACLAIGWRRGRRLPAMMHAGASEGLLIHAFGIAATAVFLVAAFRSARLAGLYAWDAWAFWVPKAEAIYYLGRLDAQFFTLLPGSSYPPLLPVLHAAAFHAMGSVDVVTLHVQGWFFGVGFIWALAGLLSTRVPAWAIWPFVLLALVAPRIGRRLHIPEADLLLDYLFVLAAVLAFFWLRDRQPWQLACATILLCGAVLTKREGLLLAAIVLAALLLSAVRDLRGILRPVAVAGVAVAVAAVPWRLWYVAHGVSGEGPSGGLLSTDFGRLQESLRLAVEVFFDDGYWLLIPTVAVGALVLAGIAGAWRAVAFFGLLVVFVTLGGGWITWAVPELEITNELGANPIVRFMGAATLACVAATPVLLAAAWRTGAGPALRTAPATWTRSWIVGATIVAVPMLAYSASALVTGAPRLPTRDECVAVASEADLKVEVVYGRLDDPQAAEELLADISRVGFVGARVALDGCGRWKVVYDRVASFAEAQALAHQVRRAGFAAEVQQGS
jgi:hypothetical protein